MTVATKTGNTAVVFEGTFAELREHLASLTLAPQEQVRLEATGLQQFVASKPPLSPEEYQEMIDSIVAAQDEEDVRNAYRIAGY